MAHGDRHPMIEAHETQAVIMLSGKAEAGVIVLCDHASATLPERYGTLGLPPSQLLRHIAYDIGAEGVTRALATRLNAPALLTRVSRLLIDPNRGLDDPTLIMRISDGAVIPGNRHLDATERDDRVSRYYTPYHSAIATLIDQCLAHGVPPILVSIHSFTPIWKGAQRPWHVGILWDKDPRLAQALLSAFASDPTLVVGDNEPYSGVLKGDTLWQHGSQRGLAHAIIEVRQDLISTPQGQLEWADRIALILERLLGDETQRTHLNAVIHYGSHTDQPFRTTPERASP